MNPIVVILLTLMIFAWVVFLFWEIMRSSPLAKLLKKIGSNYPAGPIEKTSKRRNAVFTSTNALDSYSGADVSIVSAGIYIVHFFLFKAFLRNAFIPWNLLKIERVSWLKIRIDITGCDSLYMYAVPGTLNAAVNMYKNAQPAT